MVVFSTQNAAKKTIFAIDYLHKNENKLIVYFDKTWLYYKFMVGSNLNHQI